MDYSKMTKEELRAYMLSHRDDVEAFQAYMDLVRLTPKAIYESAEELIADLPKLLGQDDNYCVGHS